MQRRTRFDLLAIGVCSVTMALPMEALAVADQRATSARDAEVATRTASGGPAGFSTTPIDRPFASQAIADVELQAHGALVGYVADSTGNPIEGQSVVLRQGRHPIGSAKTDASGRFAIGNLRGGGYQVSAGGADRLIRAWTSGTAPPVAQHQVLLVPGKPTVRGQGPACGGCGQCAQCCRRRGGTITRLLHNPWVLATLIGAAIAVPIGISINDKDPPPPAS